LVWKAGSESESESEKNRSDPQHCPYTRTLTRHPFLMEPSAMIHKWKPFLVDPYARIHKWNQCCGFETVNFESGSGSYLAGHYGSESGSTLAAISDSDPDLSPRNVHEISVFKDRMYIKSQWRAKIELYYIWKMVFLTLHFSFKRPDPRW